MLLFRFLLRLHPASFRAEYGTQMTADFLAQGRSMRLGLILKRRVLRLAHATGLATEVV
jgi:hypothetical protein